MSTRFALFILYCTIIGCNTPQEASPPTSNVKGPFLGKEATDTPQLLAPDLIASPLVEYNGTFSPDGTSFFYTSNLPARGVILYTTIQEDLSWSAPTIAPFSGTYSDFDPLFSPDGSQLYFSSQRPFPGNPKNNRSQIFYVDKTNYGWSAPQHIPLTGKGDYYSSITNQGDIYFNVWNTGDLYKATKMDTGYTVSESFDMGSTSDVGDPFVSPNEDYIIFRGYDDGSYGLGDLYISFRTSDGWTKRINLGKPINSEAHEMCPYVTTDGRLFIFASSRLQEPYSTEASSSMQSAIDKFKSSDNGEQNIYVMSAHFIERLRSQHVNE